MATIGLRTRRCSSENSLARLNPRYPMLRHYLCRYLAQNPHTTPGNALALTTKTPLLDSIEPFMQCPLQIYFSSSSSRALGRLIPRLLGRPAHQRVRRLPNHLLLLHPLLLLLLPLHALHRLGRRRVRRRCIVTDDPIRTVFCI